MVLGLADVVIKRSRTFVLILKKQPENCYVNKLLEKITSIVFFCEKRYCSFDYTDAIL